jgi:serine/threonine protein kinase
MEYFPAGDLYNYVRKHQPLVEEDGRGIASQPASGLSLMHSEGYSHCDVKPQVSISTLQETLVHLHGDSSKSYHQSILIFQHPDSIQPGAWWIKFADFGISKQLDTDKSLTALSLSGPRSIWHLSHANLEASAFLPIPTDRQACVL